MASIVKRGKSFCVVYYYMTHDGKKKQKWESYKSLPEAKKRQNEVEYGKELGTLIVPTCTTLNELLKEYVEIYGHFWRDIITDYCIPPQCRTHTTKRLPRRNSLPAARSGISINC